MLNITLIATVTIISTMLWPVYKWALTRNSARTQHLGMMNSAFSMIMGIVMIVITGQHFTFYTILFGIIMGIAYSIGFCILVGYCLKIWPSGPTTMVNNLGLLWPVLVSLIWFSDDRRLNIFLVAGILAVVLSLVLSGFSQKGIASKTSSLKWFKLGLLVWMISGISMMAQLFASQYDSGNTFAFITVSYITSFVLLFIINVFQKSVWPVKAETIGGLLMGILSLIGMPLSLYLLTRVPAEVVFPVTVASPIILVSLIGRLFLNERLSWLGWVSNIVGVGGVILLGMNN